MSTTRIGTFFVQNLFAHSRFRRKRSEELDGKCILHDTHTCSWER